jgi:hypothetical protein
VIRHALTQEQCNVAAAMYDDESRFRSRVVMARHGFGRGEYKYFAYPLPELIANVREQLYPSLADIANRWNGSLGDSGRFPSKHGEFLKRCHSAGQTKSTPLRLGRIARRRCCCSTRPATTTACTRIFTASTCSRYSWPSCCQNRCGILPVASSCCRSSVRGCNREPKSFR